MKIVFIKDYLDKKRAWEQDPLTHVRDVFKRLDLVLCDLADLELLDSEIIVAAVPLLRQVSARVECIADVLEIIGQRVS